ncbi:putative nucleolar GTP-binding protein 1 [Wallemia ichthyophaga EXF-994]|uniref:Nucleolar GTP-binding protein 1 n=1 Tax=Wallemia ichthyophaga (strain EXF-994 / CBS 113033) TaxID=1299270 RepID=R9AGM2_WALI9|nr:putative nucleolar GTP-binding protein 1 [Wallemia ichthyophaga EXF-994]EOQ99210.1 putative nucleolar GTP-binding protein 1 [Wallemia ichthyophaga EXF-994]
MAAPVKSLKSIAPVPSANDFLDIVLSKTQRKTPTVIHKNFKISRIRSFYMRKVKFTQECFNEKLDAILGEFPMLDNLHPFLSSLMNVLYDKNHYKLALGQLNTARHLIDQVSKDYIRLMKFGDSLYRCKQLKRAAMGRMATVMRRQKDPLAYLEQVRQHIARLPSIDPTTRTMLICGYPNVGKSSFINKITRADVDVQPYAFTTKSLFVGHMDYKYLRWQVIDTPGILDHPLEEMNTIEMQSITAMAHLRSAILYFMDLSEQCGYTVEAQCKLFSSIKPLFANKPVSIVFNKIDVATFDDLTDEKKMAVQEVLADGDVKKLQLSCMSEEGIMDVRNQVCETLLAHRVDTKMRGSKINSVVNRIHVAQPKPRDDVERTAQVPDIVKQRKGYDKEDPQRKTLERDIEEANGGTGVYSVDLHKNYLLENDDWKKDTMPEFLNGHNVADFVDPDIEEKLEALEREEDKLEADGFYNSDEEILDSEEEETRSNAQAIREENNLIKLKSQDQTRKKKNAMMPRTRQTRTLDDMTADLTAKGIDASKIEDRAMSLAKAKGLVGKRKHDDVEMKEVDEGSEDAEGMEVDQDKASKKSKGVAAADKPLHPRAPKKNRAVEGLGSRANEEQAKKYRALASREPARHSKASESDRHIQTARPKWMMSGKRKMGTNDRR